MIDNCADDWRIAMTWQRMAQIGLELTICAVHPVPGKYDFIWTTKMANHGGYMKTEVSIESCGNTGNPTYTLAQRSPSPAHIHLLL